MRRLLRKDIEGMENKVEEEEEEEEMHKRRRVKGLKDERRREKREGEMSAFKLVPLARWCIL